MSKFVIVEGVQYHKLEEYPVGLKSSSETAEIVGMYEDRILKLADAKQMPHYRFDGGPPKFRIKEVKEWMVDTGKVYWYSGSKFSHQVVNYQAPPDVKGADLPKELANLKGLLHLSSLIAPSGVYFLVDGKEVVYIGQSVSPTERVGTHRREQTKTFTHVLLLPIPQSDLNNVEGALIRSLKPKYNSVKNGAPRGTVSDEDVLKEINMG